MCLPVARVFVGAASQRGTSFLLQPVGRVRPLVNVQHRCTLLHGLLTSGFRSLRGVSCFFTLSSFIHRYLLWFTTHTLRNWSAGKHKHTLKQSTLLLAKVPLLCKGSTTNDIWVLDVEYSSRGCCRVEAGLEEPV